MYDEIFNIADDDPVEELMNVFDRSCKSIIENIKDEKLKEFVDLYEPHIKYYLLDGVYQDGILYFNYGTDGVNSERKHFYDPIKMINLDNVKAYFDNSNVDPDEKDWDEFLVVIDPEGERFHVINDGELPRYLVYVRYNSKELCYYDIKEGMLVETGLLADAHFRLDDKDENESIPYYLYRSIKGVSDCTYIIYNPVDDVYGILNKTEVVYDLEWLDIYTEFKRKSKTDVYQYVRQYEDNNLDDTDFVNEALRLKEVYSEYRDELKKLPVDLRSEIEGDYNELFECLANELRTALNKRALNNDCYIVHNMKLNPLPYEKILSGRKTVELRLYDEKRSKIKLGDRIIFTKLDEPKQRIAVKVIGLHCYATFEELFKNIPLDKCGFDRFVSSDAAVKVMRGYYSDDQIRKYGVLGIEIELVDIDSILKQV